MLALYYQNQRVSGFRFGGIVRSHSFGLGLDSCHFLVTLQCPGFCRIQQTSSQKLRWDSCVKLCGEQLNFRWNWTETWLEQASTASFLVHFIFLHQLVGPKVLQALVSPLHLLGLRWSVTKMMVPSSSEPCLMGSGTKNMHVNLVDQQRTPGVFLVFGCILEMYTVQMYFIQQIYYNIHTHLLFHYIYI